MTNLPTQDSLRTIGGPSWLADRRARAIEAVLGEGLPGDDIEEWRYSRVEQLDLDDYTVVLPDGSPAPTAPAGVAGVEVDHAVARVDLVDGRVASIEVDPTWSAKGLVVGRGTDLDVSPPDIATGRVRTHAFTDLARALAEPVVVEVPRGMVLDGPVVVRSHVGRAGALAATHLLVVAGSDSEVQVLETTTSADVASLLVGLVEVDAADGAKVSHQSVQLLGASTIAIAQHTARVSDAATHRLLHAALGGARARQRIDVDLVGRGAHGDISALYLGGDHQVHDLRTFMTHDGPDTTSVIECRGAVDDASHAIYTGLIRITGKGQGSDAEQANRIVKLSGDAWAESVPNLEIEHNDVRCSHASSVGPIDPDQQFYLETRGVPTDVARRLVVAGFFEELLGRSATPEVAKVVGDVVGSRLGGGS